MVIKVYIEPANGFSEKQILDWLNDGKAYLEGLGGNVYLAKPQASQDELIGQIMGIEEIKLCLKN